MQHNQLPTTTTILYGTIAGLVAFAANFNTPNIATGIRLCTINASVDRPVLIKATCQVVTAFNAGSTNVLTLGTTSASANELLAAADITEGTPGFYPSGANTGKLYITAPTEIWMKFTQTGGAATTGQARFFLEVNPMDPDQQPSL